MQERENAVTSSTRPVPKEAYIYSFHDTLPNLAIPVRIA